MRKCSELTEQEKAFIRENYLTLTQGEIARALNVARHTIKNFARYNRLHKGPSEAGQFKKGHVSWNTGKYVRVSQKSEFKKGNLPANTKHDGCISIRTDKRGMPYKWIRIAKGEWIYYSRYVYEQQIGPIPDGHLVSFKDGDTLNCHPDNLFLLSKKDNARRNHNKEKATKQFHELHDNYVAGILSRGNTELRPLIREDKELIEVKRQSLLLKRAINHASHIQ